MPGLVVEGGAEANGMAAKGLLGSPVTKDNNASSTAATKSQPPAVTTTSNSKGQPSEALEVPPPCVDTSIDQLYDNVCEMQSSGDGSPSRQSFGSDNESRIDSELRHLVGGEVEEEEEQEEVRPAEGDVASGNQNGEVGVKENGSSQDKARENGDSAAAAAGAAAPSSGSKSSGSKQQKKKAGRAQLQLQSDASPVSSLGNNKISPEKPERSGAGKEASSGKRQKNSALKDEKLQPQQQQQNEGTEDTSDAGLDNPNLGPYLLKHARDLIAAGNHRRALEYAARAAKSYEKCANGAPNLEWVMSLHVLAAIHCSLGQHEQALPVLQQSLELPVPDQGQDHALAKFAGYMQLGDTYAMLGKLEQAISSYTMGLEVQKQALGERDSRVGETYRYLAEVHVQALRFDEADRLCKIALDIHRECGEPASVEETADRRLLGLICETKGDYEGALENLVLASMAMVANGQETEVASVDCSIGDAYLSLARYDEAVFAYQKALTKYKAAKGENHPNVASVFVRLADLYNKTGKLRDSKSYCENALRIYGKPPPGTPLEDIASGYTDVSAIYESMNEYDQALKLLQKALKTYSDTPGQQSTIAGIEAQMGVMNYMLGNYSDSYLLLRTAIAKLRECGDKRSAFFGVALNQMGLACIQRYAINEAVDLFEEARGILERECGPYHPDTLGVYSNLAGTYDAMGRLDDAIEILEYIVAIREDKLGTANPDVDEEKRRLAELLKEAGRVRSRKARSLENLLDSNNPRVEKKTTTAA